MIKDDSISGEADYYIELTAVRYVVGMLESWDEMRV